MQEAQAGVAKITEPYARPGVDQRVQDPLSGDFFQADAMTWDEMDELERKRYSGQVKPGRTRVRTI